MYNPERFTQADTGLMHALIAAHPLAVLVTHDDGLPDADHLPLELLAGHAGQAILHGHVARANPLWRRAGQPVLAVFRGPSRYVTPDRVEKVEKHGRVVPTWDYQVVHVHGRLRAIDDAHWLRALVECQSARQEAVRPDPWAVGDAPPEYIAAMLRAIVGIEIAIERIEGKWTSAPPRGAAQ